MTRTWMPSTTSLCRPRASARNNLRGCDILKSDLSSKTDEHDAEGYKPSVFRRARKPEFIKTVQAVSSGPAMRGKILRFHSRPNHLPMAPSCPGTRGVGHRHERWDGMRWTRMRF